MLQWDKMEQNTVDLKELKGILNKKIFTIWRKKKFKTIFKKKKYNKNKIKESYKN